MECCEKIMGDVTKYFPRKIKKAYFCNECKITRVFPYEAVEYITFSILLEKEKNNGMD